MPVFPSAQPMQVLTFVRSTAGVKNKKAVKSDPGERTKDLVGQRLPHVGVGIRLNGFIATALTPSNARIITIPYQHLSTGQVKINPS